MHYIVIASNLSKTIAIDTIKIVDNLSFFERCPLGKESFALTLDYLKKQIDITKRKNTYFTKGVSLYALYRFPWVFLDGEDGCDDRDMGGNVVSRHVTRDTGTSVQVQSQHSSVRVVRDDSNIKEALLEAAALEHALINTDEVMIPDDATVEEKENLVEGNEEKEEVDYRPQQESMLNLMNIQIA
ncbi:hypothetical protein FXO37_29823 [Capsicum annuum]|nr:hypothetical protein FXO37_29823 [Capsicum annuum]